MPHGIFLSAETGEGLDELKERLLCQITGHARVLSLEITPEQSDLIALLHRKGTVLKGEYRDDGVFEAIARIPENLLHLFEKYEKHESQTVRTAAGSWTMRSAEI